MKKFKRLWILPFFAFVLSACEHNIPGTGDVFSVDPLLYLEIVKFSSPEYLNYVVAEKDYSGDEEHLCTIRGAGGSCQELFLGSSPYIALPNDYYVVNWKWGSFLYQPTNFLINVKWSDVKNRHQRWDYPSIVLTSHFIKEWGGPTYQEIDKYLNIAPPAYIDSTRNARIPVDYIRPDWVYGYDSITEVPDSLLHEYMAGVKQLDSLQNVYIERISKIIEEGALDKCSSFAMY